VLRLTRVCLAHLADDLDAIEDAFDQIEALGGVARGLKLKQLLRFLTGPCFGGGRVAV
jgi:hypothetical protein